MGRPDFIVIDVETTGLRIHNGDRAFLVGGMLPDGSTGLINIGVGPYDTSGADVLGLLRDPLVYKVMHNAKFDLNALRRVDIKVAGPVIDTMILAQLHGRQHPSYGLKELSAEILGRPHLSVAARDAWLADYKKANGLDAPWDLIPRSIMEPYLMEDLDCTRRLFEALWPMVKDHPSLDMEMALVHVVAEMEYNGMPVDVALLRLEQVNLDLRSQALRQAAVDLSGRPEFNPASSKQLADVLYRERGQVVRHNTPKGAPSTDTDALGEMVDPLVDTVLELRAAEKVRGTYVEGLLARVDEVGSVHPSLHQNGAITTGRFSCVAADTLIEMPRDLSAHRDGVPITRVRTGDWVYAFDWNRELVLKRVMWVGQTGVRETVCVTVENSDGHQLRLRLTPDHLVRLRCGDWRPAGALLHKPGSPHRADGPRVMTMVRRAVKEGYIRFFPHSVARRNGVWGGGKNAEHRWVYEEITGRKVSTKTDVHHRDGNRANNDPKNLEALTIRQHRGNLAIHPHWGKRKPGVALYSGPTDYHVVSIEPGCLEPVWDMQVEDVHNFIANGVCVHNCSDPNLQNLPRVDEADVASPYNIVRRAFIPDPGGMMLFADYNQIEARLFAHYSCDPKMIQPILNGQDLHELTSNMLFGGGWGEEERKALRQVAKTLNFATLYGAGAEQLASQIRRLLRGYKNAGLKSLQNCSSLDARGIRAHYFKVYPGVHGLMTQTKNEILRTAGADGMGHVVDVFGNRYVAHRQKAYRAANYLVQGTAAHLMKRALVDLYNNINGGPLRGELYILNTIHDEVILEVREEYYNNNKEKILRCIKTSMEDHNTFRVPITVELSYSNTNWKEKKKIQELSV